MPLADSRITSTQIRLTLEKLQTAYQEQKITEWIDVSCIMAKEHTRDKDLMLDFLTYTKHFRKSASDDLFETVLSFIQQTSRSIKTGDRNEVIQFPEHCVAFSITK